MIIADEQGLTSLGKMWKEFSGFRDDTPLTREFVTSRFTLRPGSDCYWELITPQFTVRCCPEYIHELGQARWDSWPTARPGHNISNIPYWLAPQTIGQLRWLLWRLDIPFPEAPEKTNHDDQTAGHAGPVPERSAHAGESPAVCQQPVHGGLENADGRAAE